MKGAAAPFALLAALGVLPFVGNPYLVTFVFTMLIAYVLAQSWDWVAGEMGYVNLGHYCFYGIGAYAFAIVLVAKYPAPLAVLAAVVAALVVAVVLSVPLFRLRGDYFAFATLALLPLAELLAFNLRGLTNGADGLVLPTKSVVELTYFLALALCVIAFLVTIRINGLRFGYALKSIRNDEQVAEVLGVRILPVKIRVLALSGAFASLAGAVQSWRMSYIDPPAVFGLDVALVPIAMVLLGGSGLRWGPLFGVVLLSCIQQWLLLNLHTMQMTIYGAIILLIGRFMPGGVLRAGWVRDSRWLGGLSQEHHEYIAAGGAVGAPGQPAAADTPLPLPLPVRRPDRSRTLLECRNMRMQFGGNVAVDDVSLSIMEGEIVGLIGPNGSGKTTLFNCISKVYEPTGGEILLAGRSLAALRRDEVARLGVGRTHQIPRPFADLTVQENIAIPLMFHDLTLTPREAFARARDFIEYAELGARATSRADALSLQEKKALEFARALACKPRLLLVDEVASGLSPAEVKRFVTHIRDIRDRYGVTIIWVEHIFSALAQVVDRVVVLEQGALLADGQLSAVMQDERVLKTYLGAAAAVPAR